MQVRYDEGVANHIGPEPCADVRKGVGKASAGERKASHRAAKELYPGCRRRSECGRQDGRARHSRVPVQPAVVSDPGMCRSSLCGNREISRPIQPGARFGALPVRSGRREP